MHVQLSVTHVLSCVLHVVLLIQMSNNHERPATSKEKQERVTGNNRQRFRVSLFSQYGPVHHGRHNHRHQVIINSSGGSAAASKRTGAMAQGLSQHGKPMAHRTEVMTRHREKASSDSLLQRVPLTQSGVSPVNTAICRYVRYHDYRRKSDSSPATSENHLHPSRQIPPHREKPKSVHASGRCHRMTLSSEPVT